MHWKEKEKFQNISKVHLWLIFSLEDILFGKNTKKGAKIDFRPKFIIF